MRILGSENPHKATRIPKIECFLWNFSERSFRAFLFREPTTTGVSFLDVLQQWLFPQLQDNGPDNFIWQEDGPSDWHILLYLGVHKGSCVSTSATTWLTRLR